MINGIDHHPWCLMDNEKHPIPYPQVYNISNLIWKVGLRLHTSGQHKIKGPSPLIGNSMKNRT